MREWLMQLDKNDRRTVGIAIKDVEYSWPIGLPLCRPMSGIKGMWEVRCNLSDKRIARILFIIDGSQMILLHGFIKKTQKTEQKDIQIASQRQKEYKDYGTPS